MTQANIIIADDIFSNRLLLQNVLEQLGHKCKVVENGKKLVDELLLEKYDIVFTDIEMPVMNGLEVARHIRNNSEKTISEIPIIALTAHNLKEFSDKLNDTGFDDIMSKPYSTEKFSEIIDKYLHPNKT